MEKSFVPAESAGCSYFPDKCIRITTPLKSDCSPSSRVEVGACIIKSRCVHVPCSIHHQVADHLILWPPKNVVVQIVTILIQLKDHAIGNSGGSHRNGTGSGVHI